MTNKLEHIAFIMDGNRRWAKKNKLPLIAGHEKGAEKLTEIVKEAKNSGIKYVTVYAFSIENWQREKSEVDGLMSLLRKYLDSAFDEIEKNNARIVFIGERKMLAYDIVEKMEQIEKRTANNRDITLCIALSYGGRQEIVAAAKKIAEYAQSGALNAKDVDEKKFSDMLYTKDLPNPDLIIRTSGEKRISNFLLWQLSYSELYFSDTLWPDFSKQELAKIIKDYENRERRYGKS